MNLRYLTHLILNKYRYPKTIRWKVVIRRELFHNACFVCQDGSCYSVAPDGDIEGLCRNKRGSLSGAEIVKQAIRDGGIKCNCFGEALYSFYCRNGFQPIAWCEFDWRYAPRGATHAEPLIFFAYTGKECRIPYKTFMKQAPSSDFMQAYKERDSFIESSSYKEEKKPPKQT